MNDIITPQNALIVPGASDDLRLSHGRRPLPLSKEDRNAIAPGFGAEHNLHGSRRAARQFSMLQHLHPVQLWAPTNVPNAAASAVVSLRNAHKAWAVFHFNEAASANATAITFNQATSLAAGTNKVGPAVPVYYNSNATGVVGGDTMTRQTNWTYLFTINNSANASIVVYEIDPALLDVNGGYYFVYFTMTTIGAATNFVGGVLWLLERYEQLTPPGAFV